MPFTDFAGAAVAAFVPVGCAFAEFFAADGAASTAATRAGFVVAAPAAGFGFVDPLFAGVLDLAAAGVDTGSCLVSAISAVGVLAGFGAVDKPRDGALASERGDRAVVAFALAAFAMFNLPPDANSPDFAETSSSSHDASLSRNLERDLCHIPGTSCIISELATGLHPFQAARIARTPQSIMRPDLSDAIV